MKSHRPVTSTLSPYDVLPFGALALVVALGWGALLAHPASAVHYVSAPSTTPPPPPTESPAVAPVSIAVVNTPAPAARPVVAPARRSDPVEPREAPTPPEVLDPPIELDPVSSHEVEAIRLEAVPLHIDGL